MIPASRSPYVAVAVAVALLVAACGVDSEGSAPDEVESPASVVAEITSTSLEPPITTVTQLRADQGGPVMGTGDIDPGLQPFIETAAVDLAERLGIEVTDIVVDSAVLTVWADTSLGCPDPKMMYAQVLTDGAAIALRAGGDTYWYHSGGTQGPFLCDSPLRTTVG